MNAYNSIEKIFCNIRTFIIDYVTLYEIIHENNNGSKINIKIDKEDFYFPATLTKFSQRANELQHCLQRQIRILAQKRRNEITRGIESDHKHVLTDNRYRFDDAFKIRLEQIQTNENIQRIQVIIDAFELYNDESFSNITFRLLPIVNHIQKQLCCISRNIQKLLDNHTLIIERYLRKLQQKLNTYDQNMRTKLVEYISRDIRPPVLVIPCPTNSSATMKSANVVIDNHDPIHPTTINSEDSLSISDSNGFPPHN